jgi:hypothetical protein
MSRFLSFAPRVLYNCTVTCLRMFLIRMLLDILSITRLWRYTSAREELCKANPYHIKMGVYDPEADYKERLPSTTCLPDPDDLVPLMMAYAFLLPSPVHSCARRLALYLDSSRSQGRNERARFTSLGMKFVLQRQRLQGLRLQSEGKRHIRGSPITMH